MKVFGKGVTSRIFCIMEKTCCRKNLGTSLLKTMLYLYHLVSFYWMHHRLHMYIHPMPTSYVHIPVLHTHMNVNNAHIHVHFNLRIKIVDQCIKGGREVGILVHGINYGSC